jgi:hypothetical protein
VLLPTSGKLLYHARARASTAADAQAALRAILGDETFGRLAYAAPDAMLTRLMELRTEHQAGG